MKSFFSRNILRLYLSFFLIVIMPLLFTSCPDKLLSTLEEELNTSYIISSVTVDSNDSALGHVTIPAETDVNVTFGTPFNIEASEPQSGGYYFSGWTCSGEGRVVFTDDKSRSTSAIVYGGDVDITATYTAISVSLQSRGFYDFDSYWYDDIKHLDTPLDLLYHDGFVYVVGKNGTEPRILKIDVRDHNVPSWTATIKPKDKYGEIVNIVDIAINGSNLNIAAPSSSFMSNLAGIMEIPLGNFDISSMIRLPIVTFSDIKAIAIVPDLADFQWYISESEDICNRSTGGHNLRPASSFYFNNILVPVGYGALYATESNGATGKIISVGINNGSPYQMAGNEDVVFNNQHLRPSKMAHRPGGEYLYSIAENAGLITFFIDDQTIIPVTGMNNLDSDITGSSMVDLDCSGNYLITAGTNNSRYCIYDIHENNGSAENPYYITSAFTSSGIFFTGLINCESSAHMNLRFSLFTCCETVWTFINSPRFCFNRYYPVNSRIRRQRIRNCIRTRCTDRDKGRRRLGNINLQPVTGKRS